MTFLTTNWRGLSVFTLGVATVLAAIFLLDNCADAGKLLQTANGAEVHMACTWTERAVLGLGGLTAVFGLLMIFFRDAVQGLSLGALATGALMVATPLWLIPTCKNAMMICNMSLKPGVLIFGGLIALVGLVGALKFARAGASRKAELSA